MKIHMMGVQQLVTLPKFQIPARVTTAESAEISANDRMVFVIQYPDKLYSIRDKYKPFETITSSNEEYQVNLPLPIIENKPVSNYFQNFPVPTIRPYDKPTTTSISKDQGWAVP